MVITPYSHCWSPGSIGGEVKFILWLPSNWHVETKYVFQQSLNKTLSHAITTHLLTIWALQATKSGFLFLPLLFLSYRIRFSVSASPPPIGSQQNFPMVAHSAPRFPTSNRSTHGHYKRITTYPQQSANTHQLHHSHTLSFSYSARVCWLVTPSPIVSTCIFHGNQKMNLTSANRTRASAVGVRRNNHHATIFSCISNFTIDWFPLPQSRTVTVSIC